ncbi:hypothetical protein J22TS1_20020 [Siminovitchia terrae]|uniref:hypothetical protein n=1 Tax=Siminovitchia terrae TaxID=1914933 RepID=UPI001B12FF41|nr:hypothetical protein [Siminovitchia terrae]GIN90951.1 hypothetical protein J22TS1_20020 [Siminovitchia terrae]
MNAYWYSIQWGFKPRLNKVKASGGCRRFYRAPLDKIWAQLRQGAFDIVDDWTAENLNGSMSITGFILFFPRM